jgi:hypothetical protein
LPPGANPTILSYSASAVKIYNAACSLVRFESKRIIFNTKNALHTYYSAGVVVVNLKVVELAPAFLDLDPTVGTFSAEKFQRKFRGNFYPPPLKKSWGKRKQF